MKIYNDISDINLKTEQGTALVLGKFDGLHKGHRMLMDMIVKEKDNGLIPAIFTFARAPREHIDKQRQQYILTGTEKRLFMEKSGVEILVEHPLNDVFLGMEAEDFVRDVLVGALHIRKIYCGTDMGFGRGRMGDVALLKRLEDKYGYETIVIDKLKYKEREISSTYIREEIKNGSIELYNHLLGYPYTVIGVVEPGKQLGRTLGFPTVNIIPEADKVLPPNGVYFTQAIIDGVSYNAITNIGVRPSVDKGDRLTIETHLLDTSMDMYGKTLELQFLEFEREEKKFHSTEELKAAVLRDIELCKKYFA